MGSMAFGRKKLLYQRILLVGQIALIAQTPALVDSSSSTCPVPANPEVYARSRTPSLRLALQVNAILHKPD